MPWNKEQIDAVALQDAGMDYRAFERVGVDELDEASVLDAGCFDGYNTVLKFRPYSGLTRIVGIDPDPSAIEEARESTTDERFSWACSSLEDFDTDERFDIVNMSHSLQHFDDPAVAVSKAYSLLKDGGRIVIKTVDDSAKLSYPDQNDVMRRLFDLYEEYVLPLVAHTAHTDRHFGSKCPTLLRQAGFEDIHVDIAHSNTFDKSIEQRRALFDRMTYFRRAKPDGIDPEVSRTIDGLLDEWKTMFEDENYLFDTSTFVITARKPVDGGEEPSHVLKAHSASIELEGGLVAEPMTEGHLGQVMAIETRSFPDPWAPLAYVTELRHNPDSFYEVVTNKEGNVLGYIGVWVRGEESFITHVAVAKDARRQGVGNALLSWACEASAAQGARCMRLTVRESNEGAIAFYEAEGFSSIGSIPAYYSNPVEDGLEMIKEL